MTRWTIEQIVAFAPGDLLRGGLAHFGFHTPNGRYYAIAHERHFLGLVGEDDHLAWTIAGQAAVPSVPNITAQLEYPMFVDQLADGSLVVSNFGNARLYRVDVARMSAEVLVDGHALGMTHMGNAVVGRDDSIWVNEVTGCRVWQFDHAGRVVRVLGSGRPGFQPDRASFDVVQFSWIYDIRRGPEGTIYVLDSRNFAVRAIDPARREVVTIAGTGRAGYAGDGGDARNATFGGDATAEYDGPWSLSVDEAGNTYVGDRYNHVVRMIDARTRTITTIAGKPDVDDELRNDPGERKPRRLNLPRISSMDYADGRLFVPTDLSGSRGDLIVLRQI